MLKGVFANVSIKFFCYFNECIFGWKLNIISLATDTVDEIEAAQRRLNKMQKKRKTERAEVMIENLRRNWKPANPHNLSEEQYDKVRSCHSIINSDSNHFDFKVNN